MQLYLSEFPFERHCYGSTERKCTCGCFDDDIPLRKVSSIISRWPFLILVRRKWTTLGVQAARDHEHDSRSSALLSSSYIYPSCPRWTRSWFEYYLFMLKPQLLSNFLEKAFDVSERRENSPRMKPLIGGAASMHRLPPGGNLMPMVCLLGFRPLTETGRSFHVIRTEDLFDESLDQYLVGVIQGVLFSLGITTATEAEVTNAVHRIRGTSLGSDYHGIQPSSSSIKYKYGKWRQSEETFQTASSMALECLRAFGYLSDSHSEL